ncbi:hypothetical protein JCM3766R1_003803 [Sporobolomyces carnicolor]
MPRVIKPLESYKDLKEDLEEVIDKHWPDFARFNQVNDYISICWEDILRFEYFAKDENGDGRYTRLLKDRKDDWTAHSVKVRNDCKRWAQWQVSAHRDIALAIAEADELNRLFKRRDLIVVKTLREMRQAYRDSKGGNEERMSPEPSERLTGDALRTAATHAVSRLAKAWKDVERFNEAHQGYCTLLEDIHLLRKQTREKRQTRTTSKTMTNNLVAKKRIARRYNKRGEPFIARYDELNAELTAATQLLKDLREYGTHIQQSCKSVRGELILFMDRRLREDLHAGDTRYALALAKDDEHSASSAVDSSGWSSHGESSSEEDRSSDESWTASLSKPHQALARTGSIRKTGIYFG